MSVSNNADIASMATEIENYAINSKEELEAFRIAFLGTKNKLKDLFSLMGKVATEDRKEFQSPWKMPDLVSQNPTLTFPCRDSLPHWVHGIR